MGRCFAKAWASILGGETVVFAILSWFMSGWDVLNIEIVSCFGSSFGGILMLVKLKRAGFYIRVLIYCRIRLVSSFLSVFMWF